jgi:hypothetical protein
MTSYVITYRLVKGSPITEAEYDGSLHNLDERTGALETVTGSNAYPVDFEINTAGHLDVIMSNDAVIDAGPLPQPSSLAVTYRGIWQPSTLYHANDLFTGSDGKSLYGVLRDHTSGVLFDPGANDGMGHDFYVLMVPPIGAVGGFTRTGSTFAPALEDANSYNRLTHASGCDVTISPTIAFPDWTEIHFRDCSVDTGAFCTFTVSSPGSINPVIGKHPWSAGHGAVVTMKKVGNTNAWDIFGFLMNG